MFVLDTNILVAALYSRNGASNWLLERTIAGHIPVAVSVALALEYEAVLMRDETRQASNLGVADIDTVLDALLARALLVEPIRFRQRPALADPDDDMLLECAIEANASAIVTMNTRDFAGARQYGVNVLRPGELVAELRRKGLS